MSKLRNRTLNELTRVVLLEQLGIHQAKLRISTSKVKAAPGNANVQLNPEYIKVLKRTIKAARDGDPVTVKDLLDDLTSVSHTALWDKKGWLKWEIYNTKDRSIEHGGTHLSSLSVSNCKSIRMVDSDTEDTSELLESVDYRLFLKKLREVVDDNSERVNHASVLKEMVIRYRNELCGNEDVDKAIRMISKELNA